MSTLALSTLRARVRTFVKDSTVKKWTDVDLDMYINMALDQWTTDVPIASSTPYTVVSSQHAYSLPENAACVYHIKGLFLSSSAADEEFIAPVKVIPGAWNTGDEPRRYIVGFPTETQFYLPHVPGGATFTLYYGAYHNFVSNDADLIDFRTHRWGVLAVIAYTLYLAHKPYAASRSRLRQWTQRPEIDTKNPPQDESQAWLETYQDLLDQNTQPATFEFVRLDRA